MNPDASTEPFEEEMTNIAFAISQSNFNVRSFKRQHLTKPVRLGIHSEKRRVVNALKTEPNKQPASEYQTFQSQSVQQGLNRKLKYRSTFIEPFQTDKKQEIQEHRRNKSFSKSNSELMIVSRRYDSKESQMHSTKYPVSSKDTNNLQHYENAWSKGKMKNKCMEEWLNAILIEFMPNEYFDRKIPNCALKKLGLDQNSLVAKGMHPNNVSRLYRGLFVFGMGFNGLVKELAEGRAQLVKVIWRIYSTILEYCSRGNLQTSMGDLEREYTNKLVFLSSELQKKQMIIQKNDEINQRKNSQIFKEIKQLRQQNTSLSNEKSVLFDEYNSTQQSFNEEVALRLKFQIKINDVYSLHRELGIKHQKLFKQLVVKTDQLRTEAQKYFSVASRISEYKEVQIDLREQLYLYKQKAEREGSLLQLANREIVVLTTKITKLQFDIETVRGLYQQVKVKEKQWQIERANMEVIIDLRQKSTKQTFRQYQITLQQNNKLNIQVSDQNKVMEQFQKQRKNFNSKVISIVSENSYNKRKLQDLKRDLQKLEQQFDELTETKEKLEEQNEIYQKNQESLKVYFDTVQQNVSSMHTINMTQNDELSFLRAFHTNINQFLTDKNAAVKKYSEQNTTLQYKMQELQRAYDSLQSRNSIISETIEHTECALEKKSAKLQGLELQFQIRHEKMAKTIEEQNQEIVLTKNSLEKIVQEYNNERFERNSLKNIYGQTLRIVQIKNQQQKNLNVRISLMEGDLTNQKNRYLVLQKNMLKFVSDFGLLQQQLEQILDAQRETIYKKISHVHPMLLEDLQARITHLIDTKTTLLAQKTHLEVTLQKQRVASQCERDKLTASSKWQITKIRNESERIIQALKNEITYLNDQNLKVKKNLDQYEALAETYRKKIYEKTTSERQEVYKFMVEEKKKQIDNMLQEMDRLQDQLAKSKRSVAQIMISHEKDIFASHEDLKKALQGSIRKQIAREYDARNKEAQRNIRAEYLKKQQQLKSQRELSVKEMSLEDIMRLKGVKPQQMISKLSKGMGGSFMMQFQNAGGQKKRQAMQNRNDVKKRREVSQLLKNAYDYYER